MNTAPTTQKLKILVVDDNTLAADALAKLMNRIGMHAEARYSGAEALEVALPESYDLILLDIGMPQMDGYELVKRLRTRGIETPIVALTGYGLADDKRKATDAGFTAHVTKPIGLQEIRQLIAEFAT